MEGVPEPETLPVPLQGGDADQAQGGPQPHNTPPLLQNRSFITVSTFNFNALSGLQSLNLHTSNNLA